MRRVKPKIYVVGETKVNVDEMRQYLTDIGVPEWTSNASSDSEYLTEFMGRLCYRSWKPGMNKNVSKVREGNDVYLANVIRVKHGSLLEHCVVNFVFADVSRVFTHELVRHRAGMAFSQESLRFVRLTDLGLWLPPMEQDPKIIALYERVFEQLEELQAELADAYGLNDVVPEGEKGKSFDLKKKLTSTMRRAAPMGLATAIGCSMNFRALRHLLTMRSHRSAEAEIREVFGKVGAMAKERWPNFFADFVGEEVDGAMEWQAKHYKV